MKMSDTGIAMLTALEEAKPQMYRDPIGLPTIGVGHLLTKSELTSGKLWIGGQAVRWSAGLTDQQMHDLLAADLERTEALVTDTLLLTLSQSQFDALVSFAFNVGGPAFVHSTLVKRVNAGDLPAVPDQMRRWVYGGSVRLPVLEQRREVEIARWESVV